MKKKALAAFTLLLPLTVLCACGGTAAVPLASNWLKFPDTTNIEDKHERLEYKVTFEPGKRTDFSVAYEEGSYVTSYTAEQITLPDNTVETGYHLHSELSVAGRFTVKGETGERFEDTIVSDVWFRPITARLQPVRSVKQVKSHVPRANPDKLENAATAYDYVYEVNYTKNAAKAETVYTQNLPEVDESKKVTKKTVSVGESTNFFDNEQILFVLRGLNMESAVTLKTINPSAIAVQNAAITAKPKLTTVSDFAFLLNGTEQKKEMSVHTFSLTYTGASPGQPQEFTYAANTSKDKGENLYRNVLLRMSVPVIQDLGTLHYKLVSAEFSD